MTIKILTTNIYFDSVDRIKCRNNYVFMSIVVQQLRNALKLPVAHFVPTKSVNICKHWFLNVEENCRQNVAVT